MSDDIFIFDESGTILKGVKDKTITSITIPYGVKSIGQRAFEDCTKLTSVTIPNSVTSIGEFAFNNSGLTSITIPSSVTSIENWAFEHCHDLTSITIPSSVTNIGKAVFYKCTGLISIEIPSSVTSIKDDTFNGCSGLTSIKIPSSVKSIGFRAFYGCSSLFAVFIPNTVEKIEEYAFVNCPLETVTISNSTSYSPYSFDNWTKIENITVFISYSWDDEDHRDWVIKLATDLKNNGVNVLLDQWSLSVGDSLISFMEKTIRYADYVLCILTPAYKQKFDNRKGGAGYEASIIISELFQNISTKKIIPLLRLGNFDDSCPFYFKNRLCLDMRDDNRYEQNLSLLLRDLYKNFNKSQTSSEIQIEVKSKDDSSINKDTHSNSVIIPDNVTIIDRCQFAGRSDLTSVIIPSSVTSIGENAFADCSGLTSITIPNSVTSIGKSAFYNCSSLISIIIPSSVTSIGNYAFAECSSLTSIEILSSVTSIGEGTFFNCKGLTSIEIPYSVTSIRDAAFSGCSRLATVTIFNGVKSIGNRAFSGCISLRSIVMPDSVTSIGAEAFEGCTGLTSVSIPDNVTKIGHRAFAKIHYLGFIDILSIRLECSYSLGSELQKNSQSFIPTGTLYRNGKLLVIIESSNIKKGEKTSTTNDEHVESDNSDLAHVQDFLEIPWSVKYIDNYIYLRSIYGDKYELTEDVFDTVKRINNYNDESKCIPLKIMYLNKLKTILLDNIDDFDWKEKIIEFAEELNENDIIMENYGIHLTDEKERDFFKLILTPVEEKEELWRYTTKTSLFLTLTSKKHNMLSLNCMNDISEINYSDKVIDEKSYLVRNSINEANNVFILSCCDKEKSDDLMMWRLYAKDGEGVSLSYRISIPIDYDYFYLAKVCYGIKNSHPELEYLKRIMNWSLQPHFRFNKWNVWKHFFKPYEFNYEKEIRLIYYEHEPSHATETKWIEAGNSEIATPMKLFSLDRTNKTYIYFPLSLTKVLIGPKSKEADGNRIQFSKMASEAGIFDSKPEISVSKINIYR